MSFKVNQHSEILVGSSKTETHSEKKKENIFNRDIQLFNTFNDKKKERFYMDLRILLMAGIDLKSALELIIEEQPKEKDKVFFSAVYDDVIKGKSLADA